MGFVLRTEGLKVVPNPLGWVLIGSHGEFEAPKPEGPGTVVLQPLQ